jgi:hypothetical protein
MSDLQQYQLLTLKSALGLEIRGMKRRGKSANVMACKLLGLPKKTKKEITYEKLENVIAQTSLNPL